MLQDPSKLRRRSYHHSCEMIGRQLRQVKVFAFSSTGRASAASPKPAVYEAMQSTMTTRKSDLKLHYLFTCLPFHPLAVVRRLSMDSAPPQND
jgi:hypothetical protein